MLYYAITFQWNIYMTRAQVIKHYGTITQACIELGYSRFAIWKWKKLGIPIRTQQLIEHKTNGTLVASKPKSKKVV